ncbi:MAG TPA: hypothetical protein VIF34_12420 [Methylocystis sp.]|jgi:hypothetical protein
MVEFKDVLGNVESVSEALSWGAKRDALGLSISNPSALEDAASSELTGARARVANDLYTLSKAEADQRSARTITQGEAAAEIGELVARLSDRGLCRQELGALRRKVAWRLHPDRAAGRVEATGAMAELNARIDELIERARKRD